MGQFGAIVRTGLNLVPGCGGALAQAWSEWDTALRFKRVEEAIAAIRDRLKDATDFSVSALSDAEYQLLEEVLRRVQAEHREVKRTRFANLLAKCWTEGIQDSFEERMLFVRALDRFDELHVRVLAYLSSLDEDREHYPVPREIARAVGIPGSNIAESLNPVLDLLAREFAFVVRNWTLAGHGGHAVSSTYLGPENLVGKCGHRITSLGRRFIEYIGPNGEGS